MNAEKAGQEPRQRLVFVSNTFWSLYNFRLDVLRHFLAKGAEVHVVAGQDDFAHLLASEGCVVHSMVFNNRQLNPFHDLRLFWQFYQLYKRIKPTLLFHYVIKPNIYGSMAAAWLGIPSISVITGLGYSFERRGWLYLMVWALYKRSLRRVSQVWFLNKEDEQFFVRKRLVKPGKALTIYGEGVNAHTFRRSAHYEALPQQPFSFVLLTRFLWGKGLGTLAEAVRVLRQKGYAFECKVIGFHERLHPDNIPQAQLTDWVAQGLLTVHPFEAHVKEVLETAHCVVVPSYNREGTPRSLLEAMSMEIPVITSDNIGTSKIVVNHENGLLFKPGDEASLAQALMTMLNLNPDQRAALGRAGRETVLERFAMPRIIGYYEEAVGGEL